MNIKQRGRANGREMLEGQEQQLGIEERVSSLVESLKALISEDRDVMVWIGSGMSMGCGYPDWQTAIEKLCAACIPEKSDLPPSLMVRQKLDWADKCKAANREKYLETLGQLFGNRARYTRTAYSDICACPFRYLVTTNFDPCLERARGGMQGIMSYPQLALLNHGFTNMVVYLHGKARHGEIIDATNVVLANSDFETAYAPTRSLLPGALQQLLISHSTIFVGCGLEEPVLQRIFTKIAAIHADTSLPARKKVIIFPERSPELEEREARKMRKLDIDILRYPLDATASRDDRHRYLDEVWARIRTEITQNRQAISRQGVFSL